MGVSGLSEQFCAFSKVNVNLVKKSSTQQGPFEKRMTSMSFAAAAKSLSLCISEGDADFSLLTLLAQFLPQHSYSSQALVFSRAVSHALLDDSL